MILILEYRKPKYIILKSRVSRATGAKRRAIGEIDIVAEFFVRKITGTWGFLSPSDWKIIYLGFQDYTSNNL